MTRRKKHADNMIPRVMVHEIARRIEKMLPVYGSQEEIGEFLEVSQPTVARFLGTLKEGKADGKKPTQLWTPGDDVVAKIARKLGVEYRGPRIGMRRAGVEETADMLQNRGRALDYLSAEYPADLLQALKRHPAPPGNEKWTHIRWTEYLVEVKKAWESGLIELPGLARK
jgi:hypothetical protein